MAATTAVAVGVVVGAPARQGAEQAASARHTTAHHPITRSMCHDSVILFSLATGFFDSSECSFHSGTDVILGRFFGNFW